MALLLLLLLANPSPVGAGAEYNVEFGKPTSATTSSWCWLRRVRRFEQLHGAELVWYGLRRRWVLQDQEELGA